jgi:hypothetical protein
LKNSVALQELAHETRRTAQEVRSGIAIAFAGWRERKS